MADYSLDDYIQKKKIGLPKSGRSAVLSRLGGQTIAQPLLQRQTINRTSASLAVVDARTRLMRPSHTPVVVVKPQLDARNLLAKKKAGLQDARFHLTLKKPIFKAANPALKARSLFKLGGINTFGPPLVKSFGSCEAPDRNNQCVMQVGGQLRKTFINPASIPPLSMPNQRPYAPNIQSTPTLMQRQQQQKQQLQRTPLRSASSQQASSKANKQQQQQQQQQHERMEEDDSDEQQQQQNSFISPIQSFRVVVSNLGPNVTYEDVEELFGSCGAMRKVRMLKPGTAEVFYVKKESAYVAVDEYHKRELDDKPMSVKLSFLQSPSSTPDNKPLRSKKQMASTKSVMEIETGVLNSALFKASSHEATSTVDFTVHL